MKKEITNIKDRVMLIADKLPMTKGAFFDSIGMSSANFRGKAKESPLNSNAIAKIISLYPQVDLYWLLLGDDKISGNSGLPHVLEEKLSYPKSCQHCKDQQKIIDLLHNQIQDLKLDKEDYRTLLGLRKQGSTPSFFESFKKQ